MAAHLHPHLNRFAKSRDEAAFARVVEEFGGLVFNGALRRTGDPQLAEEVTQNVFAIAARKARGLARHPHPAAWFHTTTRFEASKAIQARSRYKKRIEKLAEEMTTPPESLDIEDAQAWRDALPHLDDSLDRLSATDREIVYSRFFEELSFREIAERSGRSEAACKMRLKRALGRLRGFLGRRGVTLSATALGAGLNAELSKAAPAAITASLPADALAASAGIGGATILSNTLNTMSTFKTATLATAGVLLLGVTPLVLQESDKASLDDQLESLNRSGADPATTTRKTMHGNATRRVPEGALATRPVAQFLAAMEQPLAADELIEQVSSAMMTQDMGALMRIVLPLSKLSPEEGQALVAEVRASEKSRQMKDLAIQFLSTVVGRPSDGTAPGDALDQNLRDGVASLNLANQLGDWADRDPEAAITWFTARRDAGLLAGKGIADTSDEVTLMGGLIEGLARSHPDRALAVLDATEGSTRAAGIQSLAPRLAVREEQRELALALVKSLEPVNERGSAAKRTASLLLRRGMPDQAVEFVHRAELDERNLARAIADLAIERGGRGSVDWAGRVAWAEDQVPPGARIHLLGELTRRGYNHHPPEIIASWIDTLPAGAERDAGLAAQSLSLSINRQPELALQSAEAIQDPALRASSITRAFAWINQHSSEAAAKLAAERGLDLGEILK